MPTFYQEAEVDVDIYDFLTSCSSQEIRELVEALVEDGYLKPSAVKEYNEKKSFVETEWDKLTEKLSEIRLRISQEDEDNIRKIIEKY